VSRILNVGDETEEVGWVEGGVIASTGKGVKVRGGIGM
jgi:hypothetical protein